LLTLEAAASCYLKINITTEHTEALLRYTELKKYWFGHFSWPSLLGGELITLYPVKALLLNASKLRVYQ